MFLQSENLSSYEHYRSICVSLILHVFSVVTKLNVSRLFFFFLVYLFFLEKFYFQKKLKNKFRRKEKGHKANITKNRDEHIYKTDTKIPTHITIYYSGISKDQGLQRYNHLRIQIFFPPRYDDKNFPWKNDAKRTGIYLSMSREPVTRPPTRLHTYAKPVTWTPLITFVTYVGESMNMLQFLEIW